MGKRKLQKKRCSECGTPLGKCRTITKITRRVELKEKLFCGHLCAETYLQKHLPRWVITGERSVRSDGVVYTKLRITHKRSMPLYSDRVDNGKKSTKKNT